MYKSYLSYEKVETDMLTCSKSMTRVQTDADTRLVRDKVNDLPQLRELSTDSIALTAHVLHNYHQHGQTNKNPTHNLIIT